MGLISPFEVGHAPPPAAIGIPRFRNGAQVLSEFARCGHHHDREAVHPVDVD